MHFLWRVFSLRPNTHNLLLALTITGNNAENPTWNVLITLIITIERFTIGQLLQRGLIEGQIEKHLGIEQKCTPIPKWIDME